ncbi:MAG: glycosyltransferase family 2 protein [Gemmatimonadota bacterium]|nr:glycosyltransferase family 2 protein [Gemmatimonadota bacterium]
MPRSVDRLLVVVPAWNEAASVSGVVAEVRAAVPQAECLVVDDGSSDDTAELARAAGARVLRLPYNLGVGGAMRAGFRYARDRGYSTVVQVDADGQHDPRDIPALVASLDEADIVIGSRFAGAGGYGVRGPRRWAMHVLAWALSSVARRRLSDVTSGFKASGPRAVRLFAQTYPAEYLGDTVEALVIAARAGLRIGELPVQMRERLAGAPSHRPLKATVYLGRAGIAFLVAIIQPRIALPREAG